MEADTLDAIDNFINDASDQAAAWYSIIKQQPVVLPSAQIATQTALANQIPVASVVTTPLGSYIGTDNGISLVVLAVAAVAVVWLLQG